MAKQKRVGPKGGVTTPSMTPDDVSGAVSRAISSFTDDIVKAMKSMEDPDDLDKTVVDEIKTIGTTVGSSKSALTELVGYLRTTMVMTTAITGMLYGYKSIGTNTQFTTLRGKINTTQPVATSVADIDYSIKNIQNAPGVVGGTSTKSTASPGTPKNIDISIAVSGLDAKSLSIIKDIILSDTKLLGPDGKIDIDAIVENLESLKGLEDIKTIDFSWIDKFDAKQLRKVAAISKLLTNLNDIMGAMTSMTKRSVVLTVFADFIKDGAGVVGSVLTKIQDSIVTVSIDNRKLAPLIKAVDNYLALVGIIAGASVKLMLLQSPIKWFAKNGIALINTTLTEVQSILKLPIDNRKLSPIIKTLTDYFTLVELITTTSVKLRRHQSAIKWLSSKGLDLINKTFTKIDELNVTIGNIKEGEVKKSQTNLKGIAVLVGICAGVLIVGALVGRMVLRNLGSILAFCGVLLVFMTGLILTIGGIQKLMTRWKLGTIKDITGSMKPIAYLIAVSAGVLLVGSLVMKFVNKGDLVAFTTVLGLFVGGIIMVYGAVSRFAKTALTGAREFAILVAVSTLSLLIPALLLQHNPSLYADVGLFGGILVVFIGLVVGTFVFASKFAKQSLRSAKDIAILVGISTIALVVAAGVVKLIGPGEFIGYITIFTLSLIALIVGIGFALKMVNKLVKPKDLMMGTIIIGAIMAISVVGALALLLINVMMNKIPFGEMMANIGTLAAGIVALGLVVLAIGALASIPMVVPLLALGGIVIAGISAVSLLAASALMKVNKAVSEVDNWDTLKTNIENFGKVIGLLVGGIISTSSSVNIFKVGKIAALAVAMRDISDIMDAVTGSIRQITSLSYVDEHGNRKSIDTDEYKKFGDNLKEVLVSVVDGVVKAFADAKTQLGRDWRKIGDFIDEFSGIGTLLSALTGSVNDIIRLDENTDWATYQTAVSNILTGAMNGINDADLESILSKQVSGNQYTASYTANKVEAIATAVASMKSIYSDIGEMVGYVGNLSASDFEKLDLSKLKLPSEDSILDKKSLNRFQQEVEATHDFIKDINTIDTTKTSAFRALSDALSKISENTDVDKLVSLINTKLTGTLSELTLQIQQAAAMITRADDIESKRIARVAKLTDDIRDLMKNPINVDVSAGGHVSVEGNISASGNPSSAHPTTTPSGGGTESVSTTTTPSGGGTESVSTTTTPSGGGSNPSSGGTESVSSSVWEDTTPFDNSGLGKISEIYTDVKAIRRDIKNLQGGPKPPFSL